MLSGRAIIHAGAVLLLGAATLPTAQAAPIAQTVRGMFASDDQVFAIPVVLADASSLTLSTNSYGGGTNLDGTMTPRGGFEPLLTLFSPSGAFLNSAGGDKVCVSGISQDPSTGACGDAVLSFASLPAGSYTLDVTQNINYPNGNLAAGFFLAGQGNYTGDICNQPGGSFLQSDLGTPCAQRTGAFAVNIASVPAAVAAPEPASAALLAVGLLGLAVRRRHGARRPEIAPG